MSSNATMRPNREKVEEALESRFNSYYDVSEANRQNVEIMLSDRFAPRAEDVADFCRFHRISADWLFDKSDNHVPSPNVSQGDVVERMKSLFSDYTQRTIANKTGEYQSVITRTFNRKDRCKLSTALKFADAAGRSYDWILGIPFEEGYMEPEEDLPDMFVLYRGDSVIGCFESIEDVAETIGCSVKAAKAFYKPSVHKYDQMQYLKDKRPSHRWLVERVRDYA